MHAGNQMLLGTAYQAHPDQAMGSSMSIGMLTLVAGLACSESDEPLLLADDLHQEPHKQPSALT